jgi:hypothetical protein
MRIEFGGNVIDIDSVKTAGYCNTLPVVTDECDCPGCRNFVKASADFPDEVREFFNELGMDPKKASEVYAYGAVDEGKSVYYGGFYHLCGTILNDGDSDASYKITGSYSVRFTKEIDLPEENMPQDMIQMEIDFTSVPWMLSEANPY